jgi:hypothetical protein
MNLPIQDENQMPRLDRLIDHGPVQRVREQAGETGDQ